MPSGLTLQRLRDIEDGKILPTFEQFFKLCILYGIVENVNLKELYPTLYERYKNDIESGKAYLKGKNRKKSND